MVVHYATASEGSAMSFFYVTPQVLGHWTGSIIPKVFPQVLLAVFLAFIARFWNPIAGQHKDISSGMSTMGILLSFLFVFKTQSAYGQFWEAVSQAQKMLQTSRDIAMTACTYFPFEKNPPASNQPEASGACAGDVKLDVWRGGLLRVRVLRAYALPNPHRGTGRLSTVVRVGDQSFKTQAASNPLNPIWNSEIFEFTLSKEDSAVTFVVRDSGARGRDGVGWLHLQSSDLEQMEDSEWLHARYELQDGGGAELEVELCFVPQRGSCPALGHKTLLTAPGAKHIGNGLQKHAGAEPPPQPPVTASGALGGAAQPVEQGQAPAGGFVEDLPVNAFVRRIVRLVALHFFVVVEYFRRTGQNAIKSKEDQDSMRRQISSLTGDREYAMLYPGDPKDTPGSESKHTCANPRLVLYWLQLTIGRCGVVHDIPPPILAAFVPQIGNLADEFGSMDKIDKMQFPLPYTQVVKILCIIFVFVLSPWVLQPKCQDLTELVIGLVALGFFGLDEVAEILEAPFGNDPNHLDLWSYGEDLIDDLELMYYGREKQLDVVFTEASHGLFDKVERRSSRMSARAREAFTKTGATQEL